MHAPKRLAASVVRMLGLPAALALLGATLLASPVGASGSQYLRLKVLALVYTQTFTDTASQAEVEHLWTEIDEAVEMYWRASRMRLHLAVDRVTLHRFLPESQFSQFKPGKYWLPFWEVGGARESVRTDLRGLGYEDDSYDIVAVFYAFDHAPDHKSLYGGATYGVDKVLGKAAYVGIPLAWPAERMNLYFEHELLHALRSLFSKSGYEEFPMVHNARFFEAVYGDEASWHKWIFEGIPDFEYLDPSRRWGTVEAFPDRDGDRLPDYSPPWDRLRITEESFGSSADAKDTDGDGLDDLAEATAGLRRGTDPRNPDTDGDGLPDGDDPTPFGETGEPTP